MTALPTHLAAAPSLALYDHMVTAIADCARVDEVKDIRDKAMALEAYYKQARNLEAEREAANIRLRAERRAGELLKELVRADKPNPGGKNQHEVTSNGATQPPSPYAAALETTGISRQTAHRYQALANVPERDFEAALSGPAKPTAAAVVASAKPPKPRVHPDSTWLWNRIRDFENKGLLNARWPDLLAGMTDTMVSDVRRLTPFVIDFLSELENVQ